MNILHMRRVRSRLRDPGAFEIQVFDETPRFTAYLVDGDGSDGVAVVQSYLRRARGMEAPVLVLRGGGRARWSRDGRRTASDGALRDLPRGVRERLGGLPAGVLRPAAPGTRRAPGVHG